MSNTSFSNEPGDKDTSDNDYALPDTGKLNLSDPQGIEKVESTGVDDFELSKELNAINDLRSLLIYAIKSLPDKPKSQFQIILTHLDPFTLVRISDAKPLDEIILEDIAKTKLYFDIKESLTNYKDEDYTFLFIRLKPSTHGIFISSESTDWNPNSHIDQEPKRKVLILNIYILDPQIEH